MPNDDDEVIELSCPECGAVVRVKQKDAERDYEAKCPKGHVVPLAKAID